MVTWLEALDCGCCGLAWALVPLAGGAVALVSTLIELEPDPEPGLAALLAEAEDDGDRAARLAALADALDGAERAVTGAEVAVAGLADAGQEAALRFLTDDRVLRDRATARWYGQEVSAS